MKTNMSNYTKHHSGRRSDETMDDDSDDKDSKRKSRNLSEKKRRDKFNLLVNELSSMVSTSGRKMDKSTVLKSTISFLKNQNEIAIRSRINEIQEDWKPTFLTNEEFTHLVLEAVDGFIMVFSTSGQINYASESITSLLGYLPNDVLHMTIFELASEENQNELYTILSNPAEDETPVAFSCHLRRGGTELHKTSCCELVNFVGYFRSDEDMVQTSDTKYRGYSGEADTRLVFVGTGKIQTPQLIKEMPLVDSSRTEFTSRHSLEWKFLFLDHRAPPIIGYLPFELLGTSGYEYYHVDDLDKVINCHESLMRKGEGISCYYRFLTKGQQWIWLQTRFFITYHQWNSKPEFVVCTHRVVSYIDVMKQSRRDQGIPSAEQSPAEVDMGSSSNHWRAGSRGSTKKGPGSDCTSMSADSPASRQSVMTDQIGVRVSISKKSRVSQSLRQTPSSNHSVPSSPQHEQNQRPSQQPQQSQLPSMQPQIPHQQQPQQLLQQQQQSQNQLQQPSTTQYLDPQYVAAIPLQPVIASYPYHHAVLSPLPVDNLVLPSNQNQIQADLQRKQAELQAIIGHQQQELRRVSEQLLMARLGLLQQSQEFQENSNQSYQPSSSGTVSSTTASVPVLPNAVTGSQSVIVPVSVPISIAVPSHQTNVMYNAPDSNTQSN